MTRPTEFDLEVIHGNIDNQDTLSDCTGEGFHTLIDIIAMRAQVDFVASVMFAYWTAGQAGHWGSADDGRQFVWLLWAADPRHYGICPYALWPTEPTLITVCPPDAAFEAAKAMRILRHESCGIKTDMAMVQIEDAMLAGSPVALSLVVTEKFFSLGPNDVYLGTADPTATQRYGHEVCAVAFRPGAKQIKNQYGTGWGEDGYFWLTDEVLKRDCSDTRMVREITGMPLVPGYIAPPTGAHTYLDAADIDYLLTNPYESIYGSSARNSCVWTPAAHHVMLDGNVKGLTIEGNDYPIEALQTGNVLNLYSNGTLLVQWPINHNDNTLTVGALAFAIALTMQGVMLLNGNQVDTISPTAIF